MSTITEKKTQSKVEILSKPYKLTPVLIRNSLNML
jgi:hypothetical protein